MRTTTTEDFDYNKFHILKDTPCSLIDLKIVEMSRTGIGALIKIDMNSDNDQKIYLEDWVDLGLVFPLRKHFTVPHNTDLEEYRKEHMDKEDKRLIDSWKVLINEGEKVRVIKIITTRLSSDKFGL